MFTGLIAECGRLQAVQAIRGMMRLTVAAERTIAMGLKIGDSVAVNGICLTAVAVTEKSFTAEAVAETAARTTLAEWRAGAMVNLERPLAVGDRLDGHWVAGHVDGVAVVQAIREEGASRRVRLRAPAELSRYIAVKGSVALDGVSLTVAEVHEPDDFTVVLIPHTQCRTTLEALRCGRNVNLEVDLLARYLERLRRFPAESRGISLERLQSEGF